MIPVTKVREHGQPVGIKVPFLLEAKNTLQFGERLYEKSFYNPLNMVYDPYFERQAQGESNFVPKPYPTGTPATAHIGEGREGRLCFITTTQQTPAPLGLIATANRVGGGSGAFYEGGKEYTLSFYAKTNNLEHTANISMEWPNTSPEIVKSPIRPAMTNYWQRFAFFIRFSFSSTGVFRIGWGSPAPVGTELYIADISITEGSELLPLYGDFYERVQ